MHSALGALRVMKSVLLLFFVIGWSVALGAPTASPVVHLRLFAGGPSQRPDVLRAILDDYQRDHPHVRVEIATGGATSELQRRYLTTLLHARDPGFDGMLIDVVAPPQFAAAGWIEPLDPWLGSETEAVFADFLPVYRTVNRWRERWVAFPADTSALFLYYRRDLLEKYGEPVPDSWEDLAAIARRVVAAERATQPGLRGLSFQGAPIEGTVATFLLPYWSEGKVLLDDAGRLAFDRGAARRAFSLWLDLIAREVAPITSAETKTGDTLNEFAAGQVVFALNWGFAADTFHHDSRSRVRGRFGIARVPRVPGGDHVTALGGYQWTVSAFSRHKAETVALLRHLTSREISRRAALAGNSLPSRADLYADPEMRARLPWLEAAAPVIFTARPRPVTPRYAEVSDTLRRTTSAVLGGALSPEEGVEEIERRLRRVLR